MFFINGTATITGHNTIRVIGLGPDNPDFLFTSDGHLTFTNGEVRAEFSNFDVQCFGPA
jgi:hypothetical protein